MKCRCKSWRAILTHYAAHGMRWHCIGCMRLVENCRCY